MIFKIIRQNKADFEGYEFVDGLLCLKKLQKINENSNIKIIEEKEGKGEEESE